MIGTRYRELYRFACPACGAKPGDPCRARDRVGRMKRVEPHAARLKRKARAQRQRPAGRPSGTSIDAIPTFFEQGKRR
jgi:hypothetical protein